jgi:hypothetical protein
LDITETIAFDIEVVNTSNVRRGCACWQATRRLLCLSYLEEEGECPAEVLRLGGVCFYFPFFFWFWVFVVGFGKFGLGFVPDDEKSKAESCTCFPPDTSAEGIGRMVVE